MQDEHEMGHEIQFSLCIFPCNVSWIKWFVLVFIDVYANIIIMKSVLKIKIPDYVRYVARVLIKEGHKAYLVGGAIRNVTLGCLPKDYDIGTDALPEIVLKSFPKAISTGIKFGSVTVLAPDRHNEVHPVDVTTFRSDEKYIDGRWPSSVKFEKTIEKDLSRRDFTINALAIDLSQYGLSELDNNDSNEDWEMIDLFRGTDDVENKLVRAVGDPVERFTEDGLRPFRACRFASVYGLEIENETMRAIKQTLPVARMVSIERIRDEFMKIILKSPKPSVGIELLRSSGLLKIFLPELVNTVGVQQPIFHSFDVYNHLIKTLDIAEDSVKLAAIFHDIGKPAKAMANGHFYGHDIESERIVRTVMTRMKFSKSEIKKTATLVRNHMFFFPYEEDKIVHDKLRKGENIGSTGFKYWTDGAVRRFIRRVGEKYIEDLFLLRIADATSNPKSVFDPKEIEALQKRISEVRKKDMVLKVSDLAVNGDDLSSIGINKNWKMGKVLSGLLDDVIEDPKRNTKEYLLNRALFHYKNIFLKVQRSKKKFGKIK